MKQIRLFLTVALAALFLSSCGNKKQDAVEPADGFLNTTTDESSDDFAKKNQQQSKTTAMEIPSKMKDTPEQILHRNGQYPEIAVSVALQRIVHGICFAHRIRQTAQRIKRFCIFTGIKEDPCIPACFQVLILLLPLRDT